ncbi:MAG: uracil-DNA glycosylase [Opitutae bacterium]|nr:uracil-DNA glycosylase [Opitutae bacterium]|tara:strand:- start:5751 stop:6677 length:927 start_codon:yes stop_codon:yes gene_type:complete
MNLVDASHSLLEELKRQRKEGRCDVFVKEESLSQLENALCSLGDPASILESSGQEKEIKESVRFTEEVDSSSNSEPEVLAFPEKSSPTHLPDPPIFNLPKGDKKMQWEWLQNKVLGCEVCKQELNPNGNIVFGVGNLNADIFFCGEAPGAEEEQAGIPFVGPVGELLDRIIEAMGISRDSVYIGNVMNWRPSHNQAFGNRPPTREEMAFCMPYLEGQIKIVQPKVLVALGKTATDSLLGHDPKRRLSDCRGLWNEVKGVPLMVTYHPSYLLHNPSKLSKRKVWEDMLLVMEKLKMPVSKKQRGFFIQP